MGLEIWIFTVLFKDLRDILLLMLYIYFCFSNIFKKQIRNWLFNSVFVQNKYGSQHSVGFHLKPHFMKRAILVNYSKISGFRILVWEKVLLVLYYHYFPHEVIFLFLVWIIMGALVVRNRICLKGKWIFLLRLKIFTIILEKIIREKVIIFNQ